MNVGTDGDMENRRPRVLVLSRSFPSPAIPRLGVWVESLVRHSREQWDSCVVAPVPYCPPVPLLSDNYRRFRRVPGHGRTGVAEVFRPRVLTPPGGRFRALEGSLLLASVERCVAALTGRFPFDLIHAHFTYPEGWVAAKLGERCGVPVVITEHASWRGWAEREPKILARARWAVEHCAAHVSVGSALRDEMAEMGASPDRLHVIPLGVDAEVFTLPGPDVERKPDQLLFVGAVRPVKGLDVLLRAIDILARQGRQERLVVIGDSFFSAYVEARREAQALASELGLGGRVTFLPGTDQKGLAKVIQESALLVSPSRRETLGMAMIEALACGIPVVATDSGGPADFLTPEVGRIVPVEDPHALAVAIARMMDVRADYSPEKLREHALANFSWPRVTERYLELYCDVLGARTELRPAADAGREAKPLSRTRPV